MDTKETNLSDKQEENIVKTDLTNGEINAIELLSNKDSLKGNLEAALKHKRTLKRGSMEKANVNCLPAQVLQEVVHLVDYYGHAG